jgi:hypothetical protein
VIPKWANSLGLFEGLTIRVGYASVPAVSHKRNLGMELNIHLDMKLYVSKTISVCYVNFGILS